MQTPSKTIYYEDIWEIVTGVLALDDNYYGVELNDIDSAEKRLSTKIPCALSSYYNQFGRLDLLNSAHSRILAPERLYIRGGGLVFCQENQNVVFWAIQEKSTGEDNPPVVQGNNSEKLWYEYSHSLSAFLTGVACWNALHCLPSVAQGKCSAELLAQCEQRLTKAACLDNGPKGNDLNAYYSSDIIFCAFPGQDMFYVAAQSDDQLNEFEADFAVSLSWL